MSERGKKLLLGGLIVVWAIVAVRIWSGWTAAPPALAATPEPRSAPTEALEQRVSLSLRLDWLDRRQPAPPPRRDLFSMTPIAGPAAPQTGATADVESPAIPPVPGGQLRYMGYVQIGGGTVALLRDGAQMYLVREGDRVGPGYLVAAVDVAFVEIEYRGSRRRLPVNGRESEAGK